MFNVSHIVPSNVSFDRYDDPTYFNILHFNSSVSFLSTIASFFFILFKSPSSIGTYKWYLFNISLCSFFFDSHLTLIYLPQPLFPTLTMCTKGLLEPYGFPWGALTGFVFFLVFFGMCSMSVTWAFAYRLALLTNKEHLINSVMGVTCIILSEVFYELPTLVLYCISALDREAVLYTTFARFPRVRPFIEGQACAVVSFEATSTTIWFMLSCVIQFGCCIPLNISLLWYSFHCLHKRKNEMSSKTIKMHRQLLVSLFFQMLVPIATLFVPFLLLSIGVAAELENVEFLFKLMFEVGTLHSFFNALTMIYHIHPYRNAARAMLVKGKIITTYPVTNGNTSEN